MLNCENFSTMFSLSSFEETYDSLFNLFFNPLLRACLYRSFHRMIKQKHSQPTQLKLVFHLQSDLTLSGSWRYSFAGEISQSKKNSLNDSRLCLYIVAEMHTKMSHFGACLWALSWSDVSVLWNLFMERFSLYTVELSSQGSTPVLLVNTCV